MDTNEKQTVPHSFTLDSFKKSQKGMIATNTNTYGTRNQSYWGRRESYREYSEQEVHDIINSGSLLEHQKL